MPTLIHPFQGNLFPTLLACAIGGLLSISLVSLITIRVQPGWIPHLVSYAVGTLLGASFIEVLPHALEDGPPAGVMLTVLGGILLFFLLEKMVLWRHSHEGDSTHHHHSLPGHRTTALILIGNLFHNFIDGVLIAAAFLADIGLGIVTALAIIAHEIPQTLGDFLVLLHSNMPRKKAMLLTLATSLATLMGGLLGNLALSTLQNQLPYLLAIAAASMIYVAVADLIPGLHQRREPLISLLQIALIVAGIITVGLGHLASGH